MAGRWLPLVALIASGCALQRGQVGVVMEGWGKVEEVRPGGPADGLLRPGDVIVTVDGKAVPADPADAVEVLRGPVGSIAAVRVNRKWDPLESTCRHASLSIL